MKTKDIYANCKVVLLDLDGKNIMLLRMAWVCWFRHCLVRKNDFIATPHSLQSFRFTDGQEKSSPFI